MGLFTNRGWRRAREAAADPSIVEGTRRQVADQLTSWGLEHLVFTTELIVSELVTNSGPNVCWKKCPDLSARLSDVMRAGA
jgi:hypothetical protein